MIKTARLCSTFAYASNVVTICATEPSLQIVSRGRHCRSSIGHDLILIDLCGRVVMATIDLDHQLGFPLEEVSNKRPDGRLLLKGEAGLTKESQRGPEAHVFVRHRAAQRFGPRAG